jgi:ATP-dependent DNA helicase RecG
MLLEEITDVSIIEDSRLECKQRLNHENVEGWIKTVAGFSNAEGGSLFIGVEDGTNKLIGMSRHDADSERNYFNNQVSEHVYPRPSIDIRFLSYLNNGRELFVLRIDVEESEVKPVLVRFKGIPSIYMRRSGFTNGATTEEIIAMAIRSQSKQYDVLDSEQSYNRDDFSHLFAFFGKTNDGASLTDKALKSIGFFNSDNKLKNGALLFSDLYNNGNTSVKCSVFSGFNKGSERIVTVNEFTGNITDSISFMVEFVKQRENHSFVKLSNSRKNIDSYPDRALLEGVVNAVAHRDYFLDGTQIQVSLFKDRLEIASPGSFYQGEKFKKTYDLSGIISKRRNELICGILVKCKVMEAAGTGFDKIIQEYKDADSFHRPYASSTSDQFTLVLPDLTYSDGVQSLDDAELEFVPPTNATRYDASVLSCCYHVARKAGEIASCINLSDSSYLRKTILANLVSQGYLDLHASSGVNFYKTNRMMVQLASAGEL